METILSNILWRSIVNNVFSYENERWELQGIVLKNTMVNYVNKYFMRVNIILKGVQIHRLA